MHRTDVTFRSGKDQCAAWLYTPFDPGEGATAPADPAAAPVTRPIVVLGHGLAGVKEMRLDAFAERFVDAGYLCLVFDYRHFGASGGEPRQLLDIDRQRADWKAAVAFARTIDGVDPDRVVVWGTSFGGGHVIVTAAEDPRIAAVISQCPFTDGKASASTATTSPLTALKTAARVVADVVGSRLGRPPVMIDSYGPPGSVALMTASDVVDGIEKLMPAGSAPPKEVAARVALDIVRAFPGRRAKDVACPIFFAVCERDSVAPPGPTQKYASEAPRGEIKRYDAGHFDIYVGDDFERNVADQLDFLARHVGVSDRI